MGGFLHNFSRCVKQFLVKGGEENIQKTKDGFHLSSPETLYLFAFISFQTKEFEMSKYNNEFHVCTCTVGLTRAFKRNPNFAIDSMRLLSWQPKTDTQKKKQVWFLKA